MIGGMQGHQNGDAAWHREQLGHAQMALADTEALVLSHEERIEKLTKQRDELLTGTDSLDDVSLNHAINVLGDCGNAIAAQVAEIEKLRSTVKRHVDCPACRIHDGDEEALISTDSTQILAEVRKVERERCAKLCDQLALYATARDIRALED